MVKASSKDLDKAVKKVVVDADEAALHGRLAKIAHERKLAFIAEFQELMRKHKHHCKLVIDSMVDEEGVVRLRPRLLFEAD